MSTDASDSDRGSCTSEGQSTSRMESRRSRERFWYKLRRRFKVINISFWLVKSVLLLGYIGFLVLAFRQALSWKSVVQMRAFGAAYMAFIIIGMVLPLLITSTYIVFKENPNDPGFQRRSLFFNLTVMIPGVRQFWLLHCEYKTFIRANQGKKGYYNPFFPMEEVEVLFYDSVLAFFSDLPVAIIFVLTLNVALTGGPKAAL
jgi:hypothetical protein